MIFEGCEVEHNNAMVNEYFNRSIITVKQRKYLKQVLIRSLLFLYLGWCFLHGNSCFAHAGLRISSQEQIWPPEGNRAIFPVTRDTWVSAVGNEKDGSNGGAKRLKVKGQQEFSLMDIDPKELKGKLISGALLHLRSASPGKAPLKRLGVSSIASPWFEGTATRYRKQMGSSSFNWAEHPKRSWSYEGSTLMDVIFGRGHTIWKFADATPPDNGGWQTVAVDPDVVAAKIAGLSSGFCIYDEVGNEWSFKKGKFAYTYFPNRFLYSRESKRSAPWLEVWTNGKDTIPPEGLSKLSVDTTGMPAGEAVVEWATPVDRGGSKTFGFHVRYEKQGSNKPIPRYLIPKAGKPGEVVRMHIQDIGFNAGEEIVMTIRPVDGAGNVGTPFRKNIRLSSGTSMPPVPAPGIIASPYDREELHVGGLKVNVIDPLFKIDPQNGRFVPDVQRGVYSANSDLLLRKGQIQLHSARNETIAFQVALTGRANKIHVEYEFASHPRMKPKIHQFAYVETGKKNWLQQSILPDPLLPLQSTFSIPSTEGVVKIPYQKAHALLCELYVPHDEPSGVKKGMLRIWVGDERLELGVNLTVWNFTLPNKLSFIPEMNAYWTVDPTQSYDYYRVAHEHRTCINRLPYNWGGAPSFAPPWKDNKFDWSIWDREVGPLLDGSAFKDLPRKGEPVDVFYLPFSENWPVSLFDHYRPSYWADEAFTRSYVEELRNAFRKFARHCAQKKWRTPIFQFYLNNKVYYRTKYNKSSAPWIFDEPVNTQDFWALRWYGLLFKNATAKAVGDAKFWYRGDISYSQFGRNMLWGIMDVEYFGGNNLQKIRMKHDERILHGRSYFAEYGTANKIVDSNLQPVLWCLSAWANGAMGVLPWQTIGSKNSWKKGEQTALFYPHPDGPFPSVRLKAFTQGQQLVEYLTLLSASFDLPRDVVAAWLKNRLRLNPEISKSSESDAGTARFNDVTPLDIWKLRIVLGEMLDRAAPTYRRSWVDWKTPAWDPEHLPGIGYVSPAPEVKSAKPDCDDFNPW